MITSHIPGNNTFYNRACANSTEMCQVTGSRSTLNQPFLTSTKFTDNTFTGCQTLCQTTSGCSSFSMQIGLGGSCQLYKRALYNDFVPNTSSLQIFWDLACPRAVANSVSKHLPTLLHNERGDLTRYSLLRAQPFRLTRRPPPCLV